MAFKSVYRVAGAETRLPHLGNEDTRAFAHCGGKLRHLGGVAGLGKL